MTPSQAAVATLISAALVSALVGCTPTPAGGPLPTLTPAQAVSETATPEPDPVPAALTIPDCETLLPIALAQSAFGESTEFLGERVVAEYYPWYQIPTVNTAIAGLSVARACWFGIPNSDGAFTLLVGEIDPTIQASIETALDAEGFSSVAMGTLVVREAERDGDFQTEAETHMFTGNVWILVDDGSLSVTGIVAGSALDALRTANPTLGL